MKGRRLIELLGEGFDRVIRRMDRSFGRLRVVNLLHERASKLVHRAEWIFVALALLNGASCFLPLNVWSATLNTVLALLVFAGIFFKQQHGARLCERCVTEFTIDAPEYAERHARRFWLFHRSITPLAFTAVFSVLTIFLGAPWRGVISMIPASAQAFVALLARFHNSYQPWCLYCRRWDDGGDEETVPDPTGGHGRPLPVT